MATKTATKTATSHKNLVNLPLKFDLDRNARSNGRILVASGSRTRNRDFWSGKMLRFDPAGVRTEAWQAQGGLVLYMHDFNIPIAQSVVYLENGKLYAPDSLKFHRRVLPIPAEVFSSTPGTFDTGVIADLWEQGYLNTVSIHITLDWDDEKNIVETDDELFIGTSEMIEFSIVTVPGDRDARRQSYQFMLDKGVDERLASHLLKYNPIGNASTIFNMETAKMEHEETEDDGIVEEVETEEAVLEVTEEEELEVDIPLSDVVNALATNAAFINSLIEAFVSNPGAVAQLATAAQAQFTAPQRKVTLRLVNDVPETPQPAPQAQRPVAASFAAQPKPKKVAQQQPTVDGRKNGRRPDVRNLVR